MTIAYTIEKFLHPHGIPFNALKHPHLKCAEAAPIQEEHLTKAALREEDANDWGAIRPDTHRVKLGKLFSRCGHLRCRKSGRDQKIAAFLP